MQTPCDICKLYGWPMTAAVQQGHMGCLNTLVKEGASVEEKSEAFCIALLSESLKCADFLFDTGIDVNFRHFNDETPLTYAALFNQYSLMQKLISVGASLNDVSREGRGALHCSRSRMCTELLINEGADVNLKDHSGMTPLHSAITRSTTIDCSLALIMAGADVNARCQRGETPLIKAARNGNLQIIGLLLEKGANVNAFDLLGRNALYHAIFRGKTMRLLLNEESDANAALRGATDREYKKCVKPVLKAGAHVNSSPQILIVSASRGDDGCLKLLLEAGADVNLCSDSDTALHYAAKEGHASCTDLLLRAGADVNALGTDMKSPLMVAAVNNRPDSVKLLLQAGAKVRITEKFGGSTLQRYGVEHVGQEQSQGYKEMVRLLYAAGERKEGMSQRLLHKLIGSDRRQLISILNADPIPSNIDQLSEIVIQHLQDDDQTVSEGHLQTNYTRTSAADESSQSVRSCSSSGSSSFTCAISTL